MGLDETLQFLNFDSFGYNRFCAESEMAIIRNRFQCRKKMIAYGYIL